jgi:hypothetical protein
MRPIIAATAFACAGLLAGCESKQPEQKADADKVPPAEPGPAPRPADPTPKPPPKSPFEDLNDHGPWVEYNDPAFTALFPSKTQKPQRDQFWEKQQSAVSGIEGVRVVVSSARDWSCKVTVYPTVLLPQLWEMNPNKQLESYIPNNRKDYPAKELKVDGKFPARHTIGPGPIGGKEVYRVVYAYKRLYSLELSGLLIKSDEDADVKKFFDSFKPKE